MAAPLVLVAGSLHYDVVVEAERLPALDETLPGQGVRYLCGGKGGNQAIAAARHGAATAFAGAVGDDASGRTLLANLEAAGVDCAQVAVLAAESSGMSVAIVTQEGDYGAVIVSAANLATEAEAIEIPAGLRFLLLQNEIPEEANALLARKARAAGAKVVLNAAPARPFESDLLSLVDILIVNRPEAAAIAGRLLQTVGDAIDAATELSSRARDAIVTLGGEGAVLAPAGAEARHRAAYEVDIHSTHGAGDAFVGALAARLASDEGLGGALDYAQAAAALHVSRTPEQRERISPEDVATLREAAI